MTYEEAIEHLTQIRNALCITKECNSIEEVLCHTKNLIDVDLIVKAVKKQIQKKPAKKTNFGDGILDGKYCPYCDRMFDRTSKFCENCGQALDWSEEK